MRTRRTVLAGVTASITLAGCSQQNSQPTGNRSTDASTGEFSLEELLVDGEIPSEYKAEFISGATPENAAEEFSPTFEYTINGTNNDVETELHITHTEETIPQEQLNETRQGQTHPGAGEYTQNIPLPTPVIEIFAETPRNLQATLKATDTQTQQTETQTFEMNYGNSYAEQITEALFEADRVESSSGAESIEVSDGEVEIHYTSTAAPGEYEFDQGLLSLGGLYAGIVEDVREPMALKIKVNYGKGDLYEEHVEQEHAQEYLNGNITHGEFQDQVTLEELPTSFETN
jgi:hypothetical protein